MENKKSNPFKMLVSLKGKGIAANPYGFKFSGEESQNYLQVSCGVSKPLQFGWTIKGFANSLARLK